MSYIVLYEHETSGDYGVDWESASDIFESYESLVNFMASMELRYPNQYNWIHIFKVEDCMLELYREDIQKEYRKKFEEQERLLRQLEAKRIYIENEAKRRELEYQKIVETREKELLKNLLEKYGDLS